jgi:hypothetical protein
MLFIDITVLHPLAYLDEQLETIANPRFPSIAVVRDGDAADVFHHQIGLPVGGRAGFEHLGDGGVIHDRERPPFGLESLQERRAVDSGPDELQRHLAVYRCRLLGKPDLAHAPFADPLQQSIGTDRL